jgi:uracil-DNA glycosylase family 4
MAATGAGGARPDTPNMAAPDVAAPDIAAPAAVTLADLDAAVCRCVACPELADGRTQVVPGSFPPGADVLLIGEAPGAQEDAAGVPFVGKAGQLLDQLLAQAGLPRESVAVANVLKCRPPGNRRPRRAEVEQCRPWLVRQIELVDPVLLVTLGGTAAEWALGRGVTLAAARGVLHRYAGRPLLATYHPSAAIRFGPQGAPLAALRDDLARAACLAADLRGAR